MQPVFCLRFHIPSNLKNHFDKFLFLVGEWRGVESGVAGDGIGFRSYSFELNSNDLFQKNISAFPKSDKKPEGEVYRDFGILSYESNTKAHIYREYHTEGFVNIYVLDTLNSNDSIFVFVTREIENNPGNWRARLTINKISENKFSETF